MKKIILIFVALLLYNTSWSQALGNGSLLKRQIKNTPYYHYGVFLDKKVVHYDANGVHMSTLEEFAGRNKITIVSMALPKNKVDLLRTRFKAIKHNYHIKNYDALNNNCEHFAKELIGIGKQSVQSRLTKNVLYEFVKINETKLTSHGFNREVIELIYMQLK